MSAVAQEASKASRQNSTSESHLSTSEVASSRPSYCSNTCNIVLSSTWRSVAVWCTSGVHSNLLGACFWMPRCVHLDFIYSQQHKTKGWPRVSIDSPESCLAAFIWFSFSPLGADCWYSNPSFNSQCFIIQGKNNGSHRNQKCRLFEISQWCLFSLLFNYRCSPMEGSGVITLAGRCTPCCCWSDWEQNIVGNHYSSSLDQRAQLLLFSYR